MANITEPVNPGFPPVYLLDVNDDVKGGIDGISNLQGIQLVERTARLKKMLEDAENARFENRIIGEYHDMSYRPTVQQLAMWRYLPLEYQIIEIADYQDLCDLKWAGAGANATADWWYKCDENGTRNPDGTYMRVEDGRGLFRRGAGANAVKKGANNTPYDGGDIGSFISDAIRNITGYFLYSTDNGYIWARLAIGAFERVEYTSSVINSISINSLMNEYRGFNFNASLAPGVLTAYENRPASISALVCISY